MDAVLGDVPESDRCRCAEEKATASRAAGGSKPWLGRRIFGG